jgi:hypothetical protein
MDSNAGESVESRRRFTVADGLILIAATGVGFAWSRFGASPQWRFRDYLLMTTGALIPFWALGVIVCRFIRPRPSWRQVSRQPGFVMCLAIVLGVVCARLLHIQSWLCYGLFHRNWEPQVWFDLFRSTQSPWQFVIPVVIGWCVLWLSGAWTSEPSWVDRLGRALGYVALGAGILAQPMFFALAEAGW